jgi:hypothetical protein
MSTSSSRPALVIKSSYCVACRNVSCPEAGDLKISPPVGGYFVARPFISIVPRNCEGWARIAYHRRLRFSLGIALIRSRCRDGTISWSRKGKRQPRGDGDRLCVKGQGIFRSKIGLSIFSHPSALTHLARRIPLRTAANYEVDALNPPPSTSYSRSLLRPAP